MSRSFTHPQPPLITRLAPVETNVEENPSNRKKKSGHRLKSQTVPLQGDAANSSGFNPARTETWAGNGRRELLNLAAPGISYAQISSLQDWSKPCLPTKSSSRHTAKSQCLWIASSWMRRFGHCSSGNFRPNTGW